MQQNKLFNRTRVYLAVWYSGVMGIIFSLLGYGVYQAIAHAHINNLDRELESLAKTIHNGLELKLERSGKFDITVKRLLPDLCVHNSPCFLNSPISQGKNCEIYSSTRFYRINSPKKHLFKFIGDGQYYLRLLNLEKCLVAFAGNPPPPKNFSQLEKAESIIYSEENRYHEVTLLLHTVDQQDWGYVQVGRSLKEFDEYMSTVRWILFLGLPVGMISVGLSSWWLAGLAMKPIYESYRQIQQFTADAAHELKTPLAAMGATLEFVIRQPLIDTLQTRESLASLTRQNQRLTVLVNDLLLLSRLERRSIAKKIEICCLNDIINDLVEELAALAVKAEIDLYVGEPSEQRIYIEGDLEQVYRLLYNLIINGIQYTPPQGKVEVILESGQQEAIIKIIDTGIGISVEDQKHIFDRFYRVDSARSRQRGGSGLGLAIAKALAQSHGGDISVSSQVGKGSVFIVRFQRYVD